MINTYSNYISRHPILRKLLGMSFVGMGITAGGAALTLLGQILLGRWLGAYQFGHFVLAMGWMNILIFLAKAGVQGTTTKYIAIYKTKEDWPHLKGLLQRSLNRTLLAGCAVGAVFALAVLALRQQLEEDLLHVLLLSALLIPLRTLVMLQQAQLRGFDKVTGAILPDNLVRAGLFIIFCTAMYFAMGADFNVSWAMAMNIAAYLCVFAVYIRLYIKTFSPSIKGVQPAFEEMHTWKGTAIFFGIVSLMQMLMRKIDVVMLGALTDPVSTGIYGAVVGIAGFLLLGFSTLNMIYGPTAAALYEKRDYKGLWHSFNMVRILIFAGYGTGAFLLFFMGRSVLGLYGSEFTQGYQAMMTLTLWLIPSAWAGCSVFLAIMTDYQKQAAYFAVAATLLNIVLNASLIHLYGIEGAAHATGISWSFYHLSMYAYLRTQLVRE